MSADFALLALKLAILTFYLGVLIYALPIPLARLKRLAPESIVDAVYAALLSLTVFALYESSGRLAYYIGGSWGLFDAWVLKALSLSTMVKILESLLTTFPLFSKFSPLLEAVIAPLSRMATLTIMLCVFLSTIAALVRLYGHIILGIGLVLYALPLRLGKDAGAWLVAFVLVFNIGLQLLPVFVAQFEPEKYEELYLGNIAVVRASVKSAYGHPPSYGLLLLRDSRGNTIASYELAEDGTAFSKYAQDSRVISLPAGETLYAYLHYAGVEFSLTPRPLSVNSSVREVQLTAPHLILVARPGVIVFSSTTRHSLEASGGVWRVRVSANAGDYVDVRFPNTCSVSVSYEGDVEVKRGIWRWRGVEGEALRFVARKQTEIRVEVSIGSCQTPSFASISTTDYLDYLATKLTFIDWNLFKTFVLYYLTVPTLYTMTLFLATTAVARLLGGRGRLSVRVV